MMCLNELCYKLLTGLSHWECCWNFVTMTIKNFEWPRSRWLKSNLWCVFDAWVLMQCCGSVCAQGSGTVRSVSSSVTVLINPRRTWRVVFSCRCLKDRFTSSDESRPNPCTTKSWSGKNTTCLITPLESALNLCWIIQGFVRWLIIVRVKLKYINEAAG